MPNTLMALGGYQFSLTAASFNELERTDEWRWESQDVINQYPRHQYVGPDTPEITFDGEVLPSLIVRLGGSRPIQQIDELRALADQGTPLELVDGMGRVWGKWVIKRIEETQDRHLSNSAPRRQVYRLRIRFFGDGEPGPNV